MTAFGFDWNALQTDEVAPAGPPTGIFFDETLRDGIQSPYITTPSFDEKLQLVDLMVRSGIRCADLGFPGSDPAVAEQCRKIAAHIVDSGYTMSQGYAGRTHPSDIGAICTLAQSVGVRVDAYIFIGVSPLRQYLEGWDLDTLVASIRSAAQACEREDVEFVLVLEDATRCVPEVLGRVYDVALDVGVHRITLCDTVGVARPSGTEALIGWSARYFSDRGYRVGFEWHGHNDRGLALANSLAALAAGCERVHGTVLGIGERAGNASIDQLMVNGYLDDQLKCDLTVLRQYCEYAAAVFGFPIPGNYPAMGRDVFTTSAGVHASAVLKAHQKGDIFIKDSAYSSVPANSLGREQKVLIDSASGANNVRYWLAARGRQADEASIQAVLCAAKNRRVPLTDDEIGQILATGV